MPPENPPKNAYVLIVVMSSGQSVPCFANESLERVADRAKAIMLGEATDGCAPLNGASYRIVKVEGE